jgi:RND family efflux transporter MFP subunit
MGEFFRGILLFLGLISAPPQPPPPTPGYIVREIPLADEKSVFATVESMNTVPARARIGGTIVTLEVKQGDWVSQGQLIAIVGDPKLGLKASSYNAQVAAAQAKLAQKQVEFDRAKRLIAAKAVSQSDYDKARTDYDVARSDLHSLIAQRGEVLQQSNEGKVLAPTAGRIITVPLLSGSVVVSGDTVATVAEQNFVLRLKVPETHAHYLHVGAPVRFDGADIGISGPRTGKIKLIYPDIDSGHVVADAEVEGLTDYFVGERVRVFVPVGTRRAIVVPERLIVTRAGIDYAKLILRTGEAIDIPVQRGREIRVPGKPVELEILSGLHPGDRLLK